jgi:hypothetical protein
MDPSVIALLVQIGTALFVPIAGALGLAWSAVAAQKIKLNNLKIKGEKWETTKEIVDTAILATEKQAKSGVVKKEDKKAYAMQVANRLLDSKKIKVDDDILSELIEAHIDEVLTPPLVAQPMVTVVVPPVVPPVVETVAPPVVEEPLG